MLFSSNKGLTLDPYNLTLKKPSAMFTKLSYYYAYKLIGLFSRKFAIGDFQKWAAISPTYVFECSPTIRLEPNNIPVVYMLLIDNMAIS